MDIVNPKIAEYLLNITPDRDKTLEEMERYAREKEFPIVGPLVGRLLFLLARTTNARRILELGSGYGYSAYWFAKGAGAESEVICTEGSAENAAMADGFFRRGKLARNVRFLTGDALKLVDQTEGMFDIIFMDIDKHQYPKGFRKALPRLRKGGLFIADNVLWSGKILSGKPDAATAGILTFNRLIHASRELSSTIIPLRDGVSVSVRL